MNKRKAILIGRGIIAGSVAIALILFISKRHFAKEAVERKLAAFAAQGFPVTMKAYRKLFAPPDGENVAFFYIEGVFKNRDHRQTEGNLLRPKRCGQEALFAHKA